MGWDALFVLGGVHGVEIGNLSSQTAKEQLSVLLQKTGATAKWSIAKLRW